MKLPFLTLLAGAGSVHALPPAPFYTLYGTARDAVRQIVEVPGGADQIPSLPDGDPRSDRPRCGGRVSDSLLAVGFRNSVLLDGRWVLS